MQGLSDKISGLAWEFILAPQVPCVQIRERQRESWIIEASKRMSLQLDLPKGKRDEPKRSIRLLDFIFFNLHNHFTTIELIFKNGR